jgi:hypothetical protein
MTATLSILVGTAVFMAFRGYAEYRIMRAYGRSIASGSVWWATPEYLAAAHLSAHSRLVLMAWIAGVCGILAAAEACQ